MTFAEAARLDPDELSGELIEGEWVPAPPMSVRQGETAATVGALLGAYARERREWVAVMGRSGTKLAHNPDTLLGADVAALRRCRLPLGRREDGWLEVAVEIAGVQPTLTHSLSRARLYMDAGAGMVLLIDPQAQAVVVTRPPECVSILTREQTLEGAEVLPGFSCPVRELFE